MACACSFRRAFVLCLARASKGEVIPVREKIVLVTGGARSGKSRFAESETLKFAPQATYIATAQPFDAEMEARIAAHQSRRGPEWTTLNAPLDLCGALARSDGAAPRLVDCLTLWLTNLMLGGQNWEGEVARLVETLAAQASPVVLVTNEVGAGIVPENALARAFRDAAGIANQRVAGVADAVFFVTCGLPLRLK